MRSLKKLLAVLLALTMVLSIMVVPAFAAESLEYEDEAKVLYDLGLFKGKSATEFVPDLESRLERQDGVALVLRLFNLDTEAEKMSESEAKALLAEKFTDADEIAAWAVKYVAYAVKNEIVNGRPDGKFAPKDPLLGKEYAKMILAQLGQYDPNNFQTACADLAAISNLSSAEAIKFNDKILIRDDVVGISFASLAGEYADGSTVIAKLAAANAELKAKAIELGLIAVAKVNTVIEPIAIKVGEAVELPAKVEVEYADGSVAEVDVAWDTSAVKADVAGEYKAVGTIAAYDGTIEVVVTVTPDVLAVESVTADNLKEIVVVFNQDVSENEEVAKKDNYTLDIGKKVTAVKVDGNTAILTVEDGVANQKKAKLTVSDKILEAKEEKEFTFFDAELPEVTDLVVTGPKAIELTFTEPVKNDTTDVKVTIKSGTSTISINKTSITGWATRAIAVPLYSSLVDGKEYTVTVEGFVDYAGYKNKIATFTFTYEKDETAPVATIDEAKQEYVKVTFNKPVTGLTPGHFSHTFSAWTAIKLTEKDTFDSTEITSASTVKTVYVWFYENGERTQKDERPIAEGETSFRILTKANSKEIKDAWGNKFVEETYTITVAADKVAPEVKEIKVTSEQAFTVEFTKTVNFTTDNLEVLDAEGEEISGLSIEVTPTTAAKKFTVDLGKNLKGKSIIVNIKNVKDTTLNTNKLDSYSVTLDIEDKSAPTVSKVTYEVVNDGEDDEAWYLYVHFNEDLDSDTALNSANYFLANDGAYTKLTKSAEFFAGNKIVKITLTEAQSDLVDVGDTALLVSSVKDVAGNEITPTTVTIIAKEDNANAPKMEKVQATARDTVVVTFNEELSAYDMDAFRVNGETVAALEATVNSDGKTVLTLTLEGDARLPYNYNDSEYNVTIVAAEKQAIKNLFDVSPVELTKAIADKIKPELIADTDDVKAIRATGNAGEFVIEFTEDLAGAGDSAHEALVASELVITRKSDSKKLQALTDYTVAINGNKITVTITSLEKDTVYKVASISEIAYIKDDASSANVAKAFTTAKEITVKGSDNLTLESVQDAVAALFADDTKAALAEDVDQAAIDAAQDLVDALDAEKFADEIADLQADIDKAQELLDAEAEA